MNVTGTLENWTYTVLTKGDLVFYGELYNDSRGRWFDGAAVGTSIVKDTGSDFKEGDVIQTMNCTYRLGKRRVTPLFPEADKWDKRFMGVAELVASWSKDPSSKVGCVLVDEDRHIISTGYNGFPRGVCDHEERYNERETKYLLVQHAEANAITQAVASTKGATAYVTHPPCSTCFGLLINSGVTRVIAKMPDADFLLRFKKSLGWSANMSEESGVELVFLT